MKRWRRTPPAGAPRRARPGNPWPGTCCARRPPRDQGEEQPLDVAAIGPLGHKPGEHLVQIEPAPQAIEDVGPAERQAALQAQIAAQALDLGLEARALRGRQEAADALDQAPQLVLAHGLGAAEMVEDLVARPPAFVAHLARKLEVGDLGAILAATRDTPEIHAHTIGVYLSPVKSKQLLL